MSSKESGPVGREGFVDLRLCFCFLVLKRGRIQLFVSPSGIVPFFVPQLAPLLPTGSSGCKGEGVVVEQRLLEKK
jgi:hypothetical protein